MTRLRVRFPDGILLQANLAGHEDLRAVWEVVRFSLEDSSHDFKLFTATGDALEVPSGGSGAVPSLLDLGFVPSALLNLRWTDGHKASRISQNLLSLAQSL